MNTPCGGLPLLDLAFWLKFNLLGVRQLTTLYFIDNNCSEIENNMMNHTSKLMVKKLRGDAILPTKGSVGAAGYDLCSVEQAVVPARGKALIKTGLSWLVPENTYGRIAPRSGLAWKYSIDVGAGVIDRDYTGEVCVILFNHGANDFVVNKHDRIAQLLIEKIEHTIVEEVAELPQSERGGSGFGSTGIHSTKSN